MRCLRSNWNLLLRTKRFIVQKLLKLSRSSETHQKKLEVPFTELEY